MKRTAEMVPGDLVITEIMVNPAVVDDTLGEWFEIKNATNLAFNLAGLGSFVHTQKPEPGPTRLPGVLGGPSGCE